VGLGRTRCAGIRAFVGPAFLAAEEALASLGGASAFASTARIEPVLHGPGAGPM
jgi:hypothetical protein